MSSSRIISRGVGRLASVAILSGCMVLAATSLASASAKPSPSPWDPILKGLGKSVTAPFSAVYQLVSTTNAVTTENETITYAQDPALKELALITPSGSFFISATKTLACRAVGPKLACYSVPASVASDMSAIKDLFAPGIIESDIDALQSEASAHGYKLSQYTQSYGWTKAGTSGGTMYASNCIEVTGPKINGSGVYCSSSSYGVLTYSHGSSSSGKSNTITIHAGGYTPNPPQSTFAPPAGTPITPM